jgi:hypothetical protein
MNLTGGGMYHVTWFDQFMVITQLWLGYHIFAPGGSFNPYPAPRHEWLPTVFVVVYTIGASRQKHLYQMVHRIKLTETRLFANGIWQVRA